MKIRLGFFAFFVICALLFSTCDLLNGDDNNDNNNNDDNNGHNKQHPGFVEPLIQTKWGQGFPFNSMLPMDGDIRPITGCGTVAHAQLMAFHRHPARGKGYSVPYEHTAGFQPSINFDVDYDWNNMLDTYRSDGSNSTEQQQNAVGLLMLHIGVANGRDFFTGRSHNTLTREETFVNYFGYDRSIQRLHRVFYDDSTWKAMIREHLDSGLPLWYFGNDSESDHSFIVDGYNNEGRFHINWGWYGSHDGYYSLDNLDARGRREWYDNHYIIINIMPDKGGVSTGYEMALLNFTVNKTSVSQNELFIVSAQMRNISVLDKFYGGRYGVALVDDNDNIVEIIGDVNAVERAPLTFASFNAHCFVPDTVPQGQYRLKIAVRPTGEEWEIITKSAIRDDIPSAINFTVTSHEGVTPSGGYGLVLETFGSERNNIIIGDSTQFNVTVQMRNRGQELFPGGQLRVVLMDDNDNVVEIIGNRNIGGLGVGNMGGVWEINCTVLAGIEPKQYRLRILVRPNNNEEWRIVTLAMPDVPNSIDFTVQ
jgi:hypothetical protein